jgi:hypothetical protein
MIRRRTARRSPARLVVDAGHLFGVYQMGKV